jgi:hypothetical protein
MGDDAACTCKLSRKRDSYDIHMDDSTLVTEWQNGTSVRSLTRSFNETLIEARGDAVDVTRTEWSRLPIYDILKTDALERSRAIEVQQELERAGVDPETLEDELISHQAMYRHLTSCLDATASDDSTPDERRKKARDTVYALQQRTTVVTESTVETLQNNGITDIGDPDVLVDVQVICRDCGRSMDFETVLGEGCSCN